MALFGLKLAIAIGCFFSFFLFLHVVDLLGQYGSLDYLCASVFSKPLVASNTTSVQHEDKIIVIAKLEREDTNWVKDKLPDWQRAIYVVDPSNATSDEYLRTPMNKGHESMAYLTYLIDNYDSLPSTIAFLHAHPSGFLKAWHTDTPLHENVYAMQHLQLDYVQEAGYVNLRCKWNPGCKQAHRNNPHITGDVWQTVFANTSTPPTGLSYWPRSGAPFVLPIELGVACCAQFVVSRSQVHERPREDYLQFRQWVIDTDMLDAKSGRVMEYLWHIIFGMEAVQ